MVTGRSWSRRLVTALAMLTLGLSLTALAAPALAKNAPGNNGTVKIHDGETDNEPIVNNEPHVCTFHLHFFFGDEVQAGNWWIQSWPPTGDRTTVLSGSYDATGGEDVQPETGVYSLPDGHYKLFWEGATNPGGQLEIKHKVFWVACEPQGPGDSQSQSQSASATPTRSPKETPEEDHASLNIKKVDGNGKPLAGAVFTVEGLEGTFTTGANGKACITGLPHDTEYLVTEIKAPTGYEIADPASQMVEVDDDGDCNSADAIFVNLPEQSVSESQSASASPSESESTPASHTPEESVKGGQGGPGGGDLPNTSTGGSAWTVGWGALLLASAMALFMTRRRGEIRAR